MNYGYARPPRPISHAKRREAHLAEIIQWALKDGLVERCDSGEGAQPAYQLTPKGEEWVRSLPRRMIVDCAPRFFQDEAPRGRSP